MKRKSNGFTLIELAVMILLIVIIAGIVLVAMNRTRAKARDQQRITDLNVLSEAMALYYSQNRSYPYWEVTGAKKGIFNKSSIVECTQAAPCIYDAAAGSLWRDFIEKYLTSRPSSPKKGIIWQYYYDASQDTYTPPVHYAIVAKLETNGFAQNKLSNDKWYSTGYCQAPNCNPLPASSQSGWYYSVGN